MKFNTWIFLKSLMVVSMVALGCGSYAQEQQEYMKAIQERYDFGDSVQQKLLGDSVIVGESIYDRIQMLMKLNDPDFYFSPAYWSKNLEAPELPLRDEEGARGFILEMRLAQRFKVAPWFSKRNWWLLSKFTVNFDFLYRVARHPLDSDDSPGLPLYTKFGFTIFEHAFPLSQKKYLKSSKWDPVDNSFSTEQLGSGMFDKKNLMLLTPRIDLMHYSNGQRDDALLCPSCVSSRNNYASGNFSTNYLQSKIDFTILNSNNVVYNTSVGYQFDFPMFDLLSFDPRQEGRYGKQRFLLGFTYQSGPRKTELFKIADTGYKNRMNQYREERSEIRKEKALEDESGATQESHSKKPTKVVPTLFEIMFKVQLELITADIDKYASYPLGVSWQIKIIPQFSTNLALMYQGYLGRDYLNVRYDLPVFNNMIALTFNLDRYHPSGVSLFKKLTNPKEE